MAAQITVVEAGAAPPEAEEPTEEQPPPELTEEPPPPEPTAAPPEPEEVSVDMLDFSFEPLELTVAPGTTVTWINQGEFEHSATADDATWDTGLYGSGGQASITFDTPGTFSYYCVLHGTPGGNGMSGTVVVAEE
jgi:plastocyanin